MKNLFIIFSLFLFLNCEKAKTNESHKTFKYWVIPNKDSADKNYIENLKRLPPPPPLPSQDLKWYSNVVFIMDSKNKVYVYQTETIRKYESDDKKRVDFEPIYKYKYPNYIELKPENLLTFDSDNFMSFLKENNDIFELIGNNENRSHKFIYLVSDSDTVKNPAYYEFGKLLEKEKWVNYITRKPTEEESQVLKYKRSGEKYLPEKINWSTNFINGHFKPFTKDYRKVEEKTFILKKTQPIFKKGSLEYFAGCETE